MKIIFVLMCVAIVVWIIALNVDARLFDGKFLIKRVQRSEEFLRILEGILECETKPIEEWPVEYSDWLGDKMYIPLQNSYLEKYRDSLVKAVEKNSAKGVLSPEAKQLFLDISDEIKSVANPKVLAEALRRDIERHSSGDFLNLGEEFGKFNALLPTNDPMRDLPLKFWDAWLEEGIHEFPGGYKGIVKNDWPVLAEQVVDFLTSRTPIKSDILLKNFDLSR